MNKTNADNNAAVDLPGIHRINAADSVEHFGMGADDEIGPQTADKVVVRLELNTGTWETAKKNALRDGVDVVRYVENALERLK